MVKPVWEWVWKESTWNIQGGWLPDCLLGTPWREESWRRTLLFKDSGWSSAFLSNVRSWCAGIFYIKRYSFYLSVQQAMWKAIGWSAAHILDVEGGTPRCLCQPWWPCARDPDSAQGEELETDWGSEHTVLLVSWIRLDYCGVLGVLVIVW